MKTRSVPAALAALVLAFASLPRTSAQPIVLTETFAENPLDRGWRAFGDPSLFSWNIAEQALRFNWDSDSTNRFFYLPLPHPLDRHESFTCEVEFELSSFDLDWEPGYGFQLALGFIQIPSAFAPEADRSMGVWPNLVEFDYFPDTGFGATLSPAIVSAENDFRAAFAYPVELPLGERLQLTLAYDAGSQRLRSTVLGNGVPLTSLDDVLLDEDFDNFHVNAFAFNSYADHSSLGRLQAQAIVRQVTLVLPAPPQPKLTARLVEGKLVVASSARDRWQYWLESTTDWTLWETVAGPLASPPVEFEIEATGARAFVRLRAEPLDPDSP